MCPLYSYPVLDSYNHTEIPWSYLDTQNQLISQLLFSAFHHTVFVFFLGK